MVHAHEVEVWSTRSSSESMGCSSPPKALILLPLKLSCILPPPPSETLIPPLLICEQVKQVSAAGLAQMLTYYSANDEASGARSLDSLAPEMLVTRDDIRRCKSEALASVRVPPSVIQMITDLRTYLQVWNGVKSHFCVWGGMDGMGDVSV